MANTRKKINDAEFYFKLPRALKVRFQKEANRRGISYAEFVRMAIERALSRAR